MSLTFSFLADGEELRLPVPPLPFGWSAGQNVRELTVNGTGTVYLPGDPSAYSGVLECLFPAGVRPYSAPGAVSDPYYYVNKLMTWVRGKKIVRYVVPGVVNTQVVLEEIAWEERDGTGDVYAKLYLKEAQPLEAVTSQTGGTGGTGGRSEAEQTGQAQTYTVAAGDCLSVICRRFYGNGTAKYYNALAAYNGIKNPHLIFPGQVLTLPPAGQLGVSG